MRRIVGTLALTLVMIGCRAAPSPAPSPVAAEPTASAPALFVHRIKFSGQTLSSIAKWYTGDASNWRQMTDPVNTGLSECCARLKVGRIIYIPRDLVTQTKPMPVPKTQTRPAKPLVKDEPSKPEATKPETSAPSQEAEEAELPDDAPVAAPTVAPEPPAPTAKPEPPPAEEEEEEILGPR